MVFFNKSPKFKIWISNITVKMTKLVLPWSWQIKDIPRLIFIINQWIFLFGNKFLSLSHFYPLLPCHFSASFVSLPSFALPFHCFICFLTWCMLDDLRIKFDNNFASPKSGFFHLPSLSQTLANFVFIPTPNPNIPL